ncbi:MAG TPA: hypothetical protein VEJ46_00870 [Candidatus Acidoferrum sp.]|nr:hypothetical protein [Candidatus Acidoferrum sp.]
MLRARWIDTLAHPLLVVALACSITALTNGSESNLSGTQKNPRDSLPQVIDWNEEVSLPDDILFVRHQSWAIDALILLVSIDSGGKVTTLRPISGFSLYLGPVAEQIRKSVFSYNLAGTTFVLRIPDPLHKFIADANLYHTAVCTDKTDLHKLYQFGAMFWRSKDNEAAEHCYKYILDRNPLSVAARYGVADICLSMKDQCADSYLKSLLGSEPEFIEVRERLVQPYQFYSEQEAETAYVANREEILKSNIPLAFRVSLLNNEAFWLDRLDRVDDALPIIRKWNSAASELIAIYPPAISPYYTEAMHFGLLEEAKKFDEDAINSYRLASYVAASDRLVPDLARYEIDLGLSRTLRKEGHLTEASNLCNEWKSRWKKLVSRPVHHPWELRQDGAGELGGRWEFSCGDPQTGFQLIEQTIRQYPDSNAPYTALSEYYYSTGEIDKARDAEATASRLLEAWNQKLGEF